MTESLVKDIVYEPARPRAGDTVRIEIVGVRELALTPENVTVNGRPGTVHRVRFDEPGRHFLRVRVATDDGYVVEEVPVVVTCGDPYLGVTAVPPLFVAGPVEEGQPCDRTALPFEDLEAGLAKGLSCQYVETTEWVTLPARFLNARAGDIVLSPSGVDIVGRLLRHVDPAQEYAHSGIMTRDFEEIAHSTASETRLVSEKNVDPDEMKLEPNALKYLWPGAVLQSVEGAVDGEDFPDLSGGGLHEVTGFSPFHVGLPNPVPGGEPYKIVPPLVVKPPPDQDTPAVRAVLRDAAKRARAVAARPKENSGTHYRFHCYSEPGLAFTETAPPEAGWAAGSYPSVCSSFIWKVLTDAGATLDDPDGLADYDEPERRRAATWLHGHIVNEVLKRYGFMARGLERRAANQIVNAFTNGTVDGMESNAWKNPGAARAVSPENTKAWFGPDRRGVYGHSEPLRYRPKLPTIRPASRWRPFNGYGRITGKVFRKVGAGFEPVPGATVRVFEGRSALTDAEGKFTIENVPRGTYVIDAWADIGGVWHEFHESSTRAEVKLEGDLLDKVNLLIDLPRRRDLRRAELVLSFSATAGPLPPLPERGYVETVPKFVHLGPNSIQEFNPKPFEWGDDLRASYRLVLRRETDLAVTVRVEATMLRAGTVVQREEVEYQVPENGADARLVALEDQNPSKPGTTDTAAVVVTVRNVRDDW